MIWNAIPKDICPLSQSPITPGMGCVAPRDSNFGTGPFHWHLQATAHLLSVAHACLLWLSTCLASQSGTECLLSQNPSFPTQVNPPSSQMDQMERWWASREQPSGLIPLPTSHAWECKNVKLCALKWTMNNAWMDQKRGVCRDSILHLPRKRASFRQESVFH